MQHHCGVARVLIVLPSASYRTADFLAAAKTLRVDAVIATDAAQVLTDRTEPRLVRIDPLRPEWSAGRIVDFAARCGTSIPDWMTDLFGGLDDAPDIRSMIAATVAAEQCRYLSEHGVQRFHFYTLNRPELSAAICRLLGMKARPADREVGLLVS